MIDALTEGIREGFGLVIMSIVPLLGAAAAVALVFGVLAGRLGLRDPALAQIARGLAVMLVLGLVVDELADGVVEFAARSWAGLASSEP